MTQDGQRKVLDKGFTVIRKDDNPNIRIKILIKEGTWKTYAVFKTKTERDREFTAMLKNNDNVIED